MLMKRSALDPEAFVPGRTLLNLAEPVILHDVFLLPTVYRDPSRSPSPLSSTPGLASVVVLWVRSAF